MANELVYYVNELIRQAFSHGRAGCRSGEIVYLTPEDAEKLIHAELESGAHEAYLAEFYEDTKDDYATPEATDLDPEVVREFPAGSRVAVKADSTYIGTVEGYKPPLVVVHLDDIGGGLVYLPHRLTALPEVDD